MAPKPSPDWREPQDYAWLASLPREAFAWEWLRRQPAYNAAAMAALRGSPTDFALGWNIHAFEDPCLTAMDARPMWTKEAYPFVLRAIADAAGKLSADAFILEQFAGCTSVIECGDVQHLLLAEGLRSLRLDVRGMPLGEGPVSLRYLLHGVQSLGRSLESLHRFKFFLERGRFSMRLHPPEPRARRMILVLRAFDALNVGATQRDIAGMLHAEVLNRPGWRSDFPSARSRAQRLASIAREFAAGGFWQLLR